ncbi:DUF1015 domain-containing protein [Ascidiimonas sp. W6]|uniref:DUF1015 domain-containing protein n=1 Tax=Ascidiimonas meishanensis TaxID=3128903 RepID=UPI0030EC3A03
MAKIVPFKAVRPSDDKVALVPSRSYEDYSDEELNSELMFNPFSFLHIINPGFKFHQEVSGSERFSLVKNRYREFKEEKVFVTDEKPCFYLYQMQTRHTVFCGILAGADCKDYENDIIKKHENTLQNREQIFKEYLKTVGFNAEPVLLTYPEQPEIEIIIAKIKNTNPTYNYTSKDRIKHTLWMIHEEEDIHALQLSFEKLSSLYIADGHHRCASSFLLAEDLKNENSNHTGEEPYNFFMSYLISESNLKIFEFNRMVSDLNGFTKERFLMELDKYFRIENRGLQLYKPSKKHHFSMYLDGEFYSLYLRKPLYEFTDSLSELDTQILYKTILEPILGVKDLRNDSRIEYGYGKNNILQMKDLIDRKKFAVGFSMVPVNVSEMKKIADEGLQMPPKSTYIEPKLRSGFTIYEF